MISASFFWSVWCLSLSARVQSRKADGSDPCWPQISSADSGLWKRFAKPKQTVETMHTRERNCAGAMWECCKPWVELKCCILLEALVLAGDAGFNICRIFHSSLLFPVSRRTYTVDNSSCFLTVHLLIKQWTTYIINNKFVRGFLSNLSK